MPRSLRLLPLLAAACGPTLPETTATAATAATSTTSDNTTMSEGTGTSEPPTTGATTTTTTSTTGEPATTTTGSDTSSGTTGDDACVPVDPNIIQAVWSVTFPDGEAKEVVSADCTVESINEVSQESAFVHFACGPNEEPTMTLFYVFRPLPPPPLVEGEKVRLEYREESAPWTNQWFSIRAADNPTLMKFAGIGADRLEPPAATVADFYFAELSPQQTACAPLRTPCFGEERLALEVPFAGASHVVFDGNFASLVDLSGRYDIWLAQARDSVPSDCDDVPPAWFQALMILVVDP